MSYIRLFNNEQSNFTWHEFLRSQTATRYNIDNVPNGIQKENIEILVNNSIQPIRDHFGSIRITSGFRCLDLNRKLGSSDTSYHTKGQAGDIEPVGNIKLLDILEWIHYNVNYTELIAEYFPYGWIHVAYNIYSPKRELKLKDNRHNYDIVDIEYIRNIYER